ncbi:hypothetical protein CAP36_02330 [Chitinophagaceae bacterium IBVUCB2]|nr:hypothetical protein CAP36_02330 [Chitinophagaceae bacterium IBVUCB2]
MKKYLLPALLIILISCKSGDKKDVTVATTDTIDANIDTATPPSNPPPGSGKIDIETFGDIKIGQPHEKTIEALGEPDNKSAAVEWGADGLMHQDWTYTAKGLILNMSYAKGISDGTKYISSITANDKCTFKTRANMGIGSSYTEVQEAYKRDIDASATDKEQITVGSIYGGIIFTFKNEKVSGIFLGAAAE